MYIYIKLHLHSHLYLHFLIYIRTCVCAYMLTFTFYVYTYICICIFIHTASRCPAATNRPILSEIVPHDCRAAVMSWYETLAGSTAALFGAPLVGTLAEVLLPSFKSLRRLMEQKGQPM